MCLVIQYLIDSHTMIRSFLHMWTVWSCTTSVTIHDSLSNSIHYMAQLSQAEPLSHTIKYVKEVVMKWSSALFEKKKEGLFFFIFFFYIMSICVCNISTSHNKVTDDRLGLPEWPQALLLASVVFMYAKPSWNQNSTLGIITLVWGYRATALHQGHISVWLAVETSERKPFIPDLRRVRRQQAV